jgi:SpoVK/Ycf46/Vps4 family AAA+-type ATPase
VSLEDYSTFLDWQVRRQAKVTTDDVHSAIAGLVLPEDVVEVAALATASGRSLFMFGPPGNGKTSLGRTLHNAHRGGLWIPHCINVENHVIRVFDTQVHERMDITRFSPHETDRRWIWIHRPFVVAGGEMTMEELDLAWSPSLRFYEAPPHVKANGGTFLIDDFGRQRIDPLDLLNRWIIPLEHHVDHLTLATGQKIQIPFRLMLIVATNLKVSDVADPAFLRRMGYRLHLACPSADDYATIFRNYAAARDIPLESGLVERVVERYRAEGRDLRASEPRDLIERVLDICRLRNHPPRLDQAILDTAWRGYFGNVAI